MLYDKIKNIAKQKNISIYRIEKDLDLSNGSIRKWNSSIPLSQTLKKVADYLNVSIDKLMEE
ncbi:helix-turn-helix transcriptional regulator [Streptococcus parasanguinis]|uniref:helix-turn-helix domain-containing protein n=1 Tax=Streptococcus parasanguinis TaxID=1318 RepID=UPI0039C4C8F5